VRGRGERHIRRRTWIFLISISALIAAVGVGVGQPENARALGGTCSTAGTWQQGELNVYWLDVEQGDSQLIVGPTGRTLLIDLGETSWNSTSNTKSAAVAQKIRQICGVSGAVHLDYVMASHHHLDHIGYASNPNDTTAVGNGLYRLLSPNGENFTVGTLLDRDGGTWTDANGDGDCDVGTSAEPSNEIDWNNAGTTSQTARRWICWLYGPAGQADRANINGRVVRLTNSSTWPALDLGTGVTATIVQANAKGVKQADGTTPVSGDHTAAATPPSENDYSIGLKITYGKFEYATAGDTDGEYSTSGHGYTYNDVEASIILPVGNVETMRMNHHGSSHSSSNAYVTALAPESAFISCCANNYGHPGNRVLDALRQVANQRGTGADIYLANNPCDLTQADGTTPTNYAGTLNSNGDVWLRTTSSGNGYTVTYDSGSRAYTSYLEGGGGGGGSGDPTQIRVNEYLMAPNASGANEWVELYNPTDSAVAIGGLYIDDAPGGGAPKQIPAGTTIAAGGRWVMEFASGFLNNTGSDSVRLVANPGTGETVYDSHTYSLGSTQYDKVFHRIGDGGGWCATISTNVTKGTPNPATCP
jgi:beta-lactamase superfamily II metal-dependent hydrolase